ncbi:hypothetical protein B0H17DRAFT_1006457 [Mycena rosella]|uniref:Uncharacterized protein n=1 Tax=Mycena rosella TaxID=1033263 RepID=A0AAD7DT10_MYCRO|nr:hypothetical protein B0H17DRAFT_1006457 [Mycena rosella]
MSFPTYSDDEESPIPRDFVDETPPSPRTELLSPTSGPRPLQSEIDRVQQRQRGPSERYRRQREEAYANISSRQLLSLLIEKEYESNKLRKALHRAFERFEAEAARASEAERVTQETLNQFRAANETKVAAERALYKTSEELRMWKFQFEHAQREIQRAQGVVQLVERQRDDAELAAMDARKTARQLNEQRLVSDALEEGRRLGYQAGFRKGQQEMAYTRGTNLEDAYQDLEREIGSYAAVQPERDSRRDGSPSQPAYDLDTSPMPAPRSPQIIRMPEMPPSSHQPQEPPPPSMPSPSPAMAIPSPVHAQPPPDFETESVRHPPPSPSIQLSRYSLEIPSPSVFNQPRPSDFQPHPSSQAQYQDPPQAAQDALRRRPSSQAPYHQDAPHRRPSSQAQYEGPPQAAQDGTSSSGQPQRHPSSQAQYQEYQDPPQAAQDVPQRRPSSQAPYPRPSSQLQYQGPRQAAPSQPQYQPPLPASRPPDNYIPSASAEGGIALPPPFQLSQPVLPATSPRLPTSPTQSWYNRERPEDPARTQSWYQAKRPRSNAGSTTGRSNAGSAAGRSVRHARHGSLDSRLSTGMVKNQKLGADYAADLGAIKEDARSSRGTYAYAVPESSGWDNPNAQGSQRARSMRVTSSESLVPPPPPPKDPKQVIADGLRYSDPDLPDAWRRDAAVKAETSSSRSRPPRNVRMPVQLTFPAPLSPPEGPVPLGHMRARSMSASTGKSGRSQPPNIADLVNRPSLRRVKEKRPILPSEMGSPDMGSPFFGTINIEPPSQSSSQIPLQTSAGPHMDQYLSPNYQTQHLPQMTQQALPQGFQPQLVTVPAEITVPVTFKGRSISSPLAFPGGGDYAPQSRPPSGLGDYRAAASAHGGSNASLVRPRSTSMHAPPRPLSALSNSNLSRKSGKSGKTVTEYVAGPTLTAGHTLAHQASNVSLASLRSTGSGYARFDASTYVDPAYFASAGAVPVPPPRSRHGSGSSHHSGISYIGPSFP